MGVDIRREEYLPDAGALLPGRVDSLQFTTMADNANPYVIDAPHFLPVFLCKTIQYC